MRVAIYAGMFKQNHDGSAKTLYELTHSLLKRDAEVGIWGFSITPQEKNGLSLYNIVSVPLPLYPDYRITLPSPKIKRQLKKFKPDVIHITVPDFAGISFMRYARKRGIPILTSFHTDFPAYFKSYHIGIFYKPAWKFLKWFYNKSLVTLAPTEEVIEKLKEKGIQNTKLWSRGIHLHKFGVTFRSETLRSDWGAQNKKVILYSGRFVWYKDLATFIGVYRLFKALDSRDVVFVLVGDGPIRDELVKQMPDAVFPGYLEGEELARVYASADIFLFPSTTETFGNVVLEALASGLPGVVSDVGGCKEIIKKSGAGLVAGARTPRDFYEKCRQLVEDESMYREMQQKGLNYVKKRSWDSINRQVIDEYERIIRHQENTLRTQPVILVSDY